MAYCALPAASSERHFRPYRLAVALSYYTTIMDYHSANVNTFFNYICACNLRTPAQLIITYFYKNVKKKMKYIYLYLQTIYWRNSRN